VKGHSLPPGWAATTLGEIRVDRGKRVIPSDSPEERFELFSIPSFPSGSAEVPRGAEIGSDKQSVEPGTVLVSKINPRINRVWEVRPRTSHRLIASTEWIPFFPVGGIYSGFLAYYLRCDDFREHLAMNVSGVGGSLMRVRPAVIDRYRFVLPPLAEQRRIVAALEEHLSDLDAAVAGLERARANVSRYRAAARDHAIGAHVSSSWDRASGGTICEWSSGDYLPQKVFEPGPYPVLGGNGISGQHAQFNVREPTLVIGRVGALCGNVHLTSGPSWITDNAIFAKRVDARAHLPYLRLAFEAARLNERAAGSGQPFVNQRILNETVLPLPPIDEQRTIVAEVERRLAVADHTTAEIDVQVARARRLRQAILKRAFEGKLVPQDPADESASALLDRIRAERAASIVPRTAGRRARRTT
jgi:type I restriction enzyme, S subunit